MDGTVIMPPSRAGHARLVCEVNYDSSQQQNRAQRHSEQRELQPTEVIQQDNRFTLDTVAIPLALARGGCQLQKML